MKNPKKTLNSYLQAWKENDYDTMFKLTTKTWQSKQSIDQFVADVENLVVLDYTIESDGTPVGNSIIDFKVSILTLNPTRPWNVRLVFEKSAYKPADSRKLFSRGSWGVNPQSAKGLLLTKQNEFVKKLNLKKKKKKKIGS